MSEQYTLKTWVLDGPITRLDYEYLLGCTLNFKVAQRELIDVHTTTGKVQVAGHLKPTEVVTQTVDQESALLLKYSSRVHLKSTVEFYSTAISIR